MALETPTGVRDALAFEAPYLIEKLRKARIADSDAEAEALFREAKRYLVMTQADDTRIWQMHSLRVDEAWHQFILFTAQYAEYCQRCFGRYIHHSPSNAPKVERAEELPVATFAEFRARYEELFGEPLPDTWYDDLSVAPQRRLLNEHAGNLELRAQGDDVALVAPNGEVVLTVNDVARPALRFVAATGAFHVRELPGELTDDEKVALAAALVRCRILRVAG
jgi:hypothetical protein